MKFSAIVASLTVAVGIDFATAGTKWVTKSTTMCELERGVFNKKNMDDAYTKCGGSGILVS